MGNVIVGVHCVIHKVNASTVMFITRPGGMHFLLVFHGFQGNLKAAEPYRGDTCHVRRALGAARARSGPLGPGRVHSAALVRY